MVISKPNRPLCQQVKIWSVELLTPICTNHVPIEAVEENNNYIARRCHVVEINRLEPRNDWNLCTRFAC